MQNIIYDFKDSLYINLTNNCSNSCDFCIRNIKDGVNGNGLWLEEDPTAEHVKSELAKRDLSGYPEAGFCGFGAPTWALPGL